MTFRWGILATGSIAASMAEALQAVEEAELLAVGSRSQASADAFGDKWQILRRYSSYEALVADPDIDIIYIATPHNFHYENMRLCLNAGKHVLCEKPLTLNANEAAECIELAQEKGLFLMEAVWMRFFPAMAQVRQWVADGTIGDVRLIQADFCINVPYDPQHRLYNPALGGGALLDLGIYPLSFTTMLLGHPTKTIGRAHIGETGVDEVMALTLLYDNDTTAHLVSSMRLNKPIEATIFGSKGSIQVHPTFLHAKDLTLHVYGEEAQKVSVPYLGNGYVHEVEEVHACLRAGKLESDLMPLAETYHMMQLMDELRAEWRVVYPGE